MRRVGLSVCLLSALVLVGCGSPQPQSQKGEDPGKAQVSSVCDDGFKNKLDPNLVDPTSCWTISGKSFQPLTVGGTVVYFSQESDSLTNRLVALDAATGKEKWHTDIANVFGGVAGSRDLTVRPFGDGGKYSVAVGYSYQIPGTTTTPGTSGYRVLALNPDDGKTVMDQSLVSSNGDIPSGQATWGDGAVAVTGMGSPVSVLTTVSGKFQRIDDVPWNRNTVEGTGGKDPVAVTTVLHVTKDRVVLAAGYPINSKQVVSNGTIGVSAGQIWTAIDLAGQKKWSLPTDFKADVSFFGGYALVQTTDSGVMTWIDLETGLQVQKPSFAPGQAFPPPSSSADTVTGRFVPVGNGVLSPDAKHFIVSGKFVMNTDTGAQTSIAKNTNRNRLDVEVLSNTTGYGRGFTYDLASDKATDSSNLQGAIAVSGSTLVFAQNQQSWSLGGARLK